MKSTADPAEESQAGNLRCWAKSPMPVLLFVAFIIEAKTWHFWRPLNLEEFVQMLTQQIAVYATHHWRFIKHHHCLHVGPSTLQLLCVEEMVTGSTQCNPYIVALELCISHYL